ncbi:hypothetical protein ABEB36_008686 [Hypothenemus hampei]|uniref:Uncharacterized protein n=1 Tax=Hypothenemus hampei TaxID=57062 RepID=A0ABD1EPX6_HYPHA
MPFQIEGKVAVVIGGALSLSFNFTKELLKNGLKGVTLADIDENIGLKEIEERDGEIDECKAIFAQTDIYQNIDILINSAGIYIPKYNSGKESLLLKISSVTDVVSFAFIPIYTVSKFAVYFVLSISTSSHVMKWKKMRIAGVCPGATTVSIASFVVIIIQRVCNRTMWVIEGGKEPISM